MATKRGPRSTLYEWIRSIAIAIVLAMLIRWPIAEPFKIPSGSMEPTFFSGDRIFVNKFVYGVRFPFNGFRIPFTRKTIWYSDSRIWHGPAPERWDIVVFKSVEEGAEHDTLVKRIVGLPGEHIFIRDGKILINGTPLELPQDMPDVYYTSLEGSLSNMRYGVRTAEEFSLIPEDHYLVLGDNSAFSRDGRYFGWLPNHHMLGRVSSIWWPISRWRDFTGFSSSWWWRCTWALLALYIVGRLFVGRSWKVYDERLGGELEKDEHLFVRFSLGMSIPFTGRRVRNSRALRRGEIVLYREQTKNGRGPEAYLGVVAGLAGEKVAIEDGKLTINNTALQGPKSIILLSAASTGKRSGINKGKAKATSMVPPAHVFVLTDMRSRDSRVVGSIPDEEIIGTATHVWWPLGRRRGLHHD